MSNATGQITCLQQRDGAACRVSSRTDLRIVVSNVKQSDFHDYPMLRMAEMPQIEVYIVPSTDAQGGVGEPGTPPIAPAVCNAIFEHRRHKGPLDVTSLYQTPAAPGADATAHISGLLAGRASPPE